jgi:hypothetical protein
MRLTIAIICALASTAHASTIVYLDPIALEAGAERVVEARVVASEARWNASHTAIETHAVLAVDAVRKGGRVGSLEVVVPGGVVGNTRQIVFGTPAIVVGENARWFLRARGDGTYRVYGWAQGKWPARPDRAGATTFGRDPIAAEGNVTPFTLNGMVWPDARMPVPYLIQNAGSADLSLPDVIAGFDAAFASWQAVATSRLTFVNAGMTDLGQAVDGQNVMLFVESNWIFGPEAAAATSITIIDGQQEADIAVNGVNFTWAIGPPGPSISSNVLDLQAVMTHEIGHLSGLSHTDRAFDTMYFSWSPWAGQRTLSIDDKLGLSELYPVAGDECGSCPTGESCNDHPLGKLCEGTPDPVGTPCNYDRVECDSFCLFTATNLSTGYCSKFCETNTDCPLTHHCDDASAGSMTVKVCFAGAQPPPPPPCVADDECETGSFCDTGAGTCTFECRETADCGGGDTCDATGRCVAVDDSGCCSGSEPAPFALAMVLFGLPLVMRRRVTSSRSS